MRMRGKPPGGDRAGVSYLWDRLAEKPKPRTGHLAGFVHGIDCHVGDNWKSRPCAKLLLGSGAGCEGCERRMPIDWLGYVPCRRDDGRPVCVVIRRSAAPVACSITPSSRIVWGREEGRGESPWVRESSQGQLWARWYGDRLANDDMVPWLLCFWRMPQLALAVRKHFEVECQPGVTDAIPPAIVAPDPPRGDDAERVGDATRLVVPLDKTLERLNAQKARLAKMEAERNGKH